MTLQPLIKEINYNLKGTDDDAPTVGDEDWLYWVVMINKKKDEMYDDTKQNWSSAFDDEISVGTIAAATLPSFNLPATFIAPANQAYVIQTNGNYAYFDVIKGTERNRRLSNKQFFVKGRNPKVLKCSVPIVAGDSSIGGLLYLPGYWRPADVDGTDVAAYIPVDDPHWLAMAVAAAVAENDITYQDKFGELTGQANYLYRQMARANRRGTSGSPRVSQTNVKRIGARF